MKLVFPIIVASLVFNVSAYDAISDIIDHIRTAILDCSFPLNVIFDAPLRDGQRAQLLLWHPVTRDIRLRCPRHGEVLQPGPWYISSTVAPRVLHHANGPVHLIGRRYYCSTKLQHHEFASYHPLLTVQLPHTRQPMFLLLHKIGFTYDFIIYLRSEVALGNSFKQIRKAFQCRLRFNSVYPKIVPSLDSFIKLFLFDHNFRALWKCKCNRQSCRIATTSVPDSYYSMDHTFKLAANIGCRSSDIYKHLYHSLFAVLDENGIVVMWRLCKSGSYAELQSSLLGLQLSRLWERLDFVIVDNCCNVRPSLQSIFGDAEVKLDLFHAVQRISKTIPRTCPLRRVILRELAMVFRRPGDAFQNRRSAVTCDVETMTTRFKAFYNKWTTAKWERRNVLQRSARIQLLNLQRHITRGCLSDIPVGAGTNRNEKFHHWLNKSCLRHMPTVSKEVAEAIIECLIAQWNREKHRDCKDCITMCSACSYIEAATAFTISSKSQQRCSDGPLVHAPSTEAASLECINRIVQPSYLHKDIFQIFVLSLHASLESRSRTSSLDTRSDEKASSNPSDAPSGYTVTRVKPDGNCLFVAIIRSLRQLAAGSRGLRLQLRVLGINMEEPTTEVVAVLRRLVFERIDQNWDFYSAFFTHPTDYYSILCDGFFNGEVGDVAVQVLADITGIPIMLYQEATDVTTAQVIPVVPIAATQEDYGAPIRLLYNPINLHYDVVVPREPVPSNAPSVPPKTPARSSCRCRKIEGKNCVSQVAAFPRRRRYACRCPCLRARRPCSTCTCHNCCNPYGHSDKSKTSGATRATRVVKGFQTQLQLPKPQSNNCAVKWSYIELLCLGCVLRSAVMSGCFTAAGITSSYNQMRKKMSDEVPQRTEQEMIRILKRIYYETLNQGFHSLKSGFYHFLFSLFQ